MTMPHLMNCPHSSTKWCLDCVGELHAELEATKAQLAQATQWKTVAEARGEECEQLQLLLSKDEPAIHAIKESLRVTKDGHESWRSSAMGYKAALDEAREELAQAKAGAEAFDYDGNRNILDFFHAEIGRTLEALLEQGDVTIKPHEAIGKWEVNGRLWQDSLIEALQEAQGATT